MRRAIGGSLSGPRHGQNLSANQKRTAKSFAPAKAWLKSVKDSNHFTFPPENPSPHQNRGRRRRMHQTTAIAWGSFLGQAIAMRRAVPERKGRLIWPATYERDKVGGIIPSAPARSPNPLLKARPSVAKCSDKSRTIIGRISSAPVLPFGQPSDNYCVNQCFVRQKSFEVAFARSTSASERLLNARRSLLVGRFKTV